MKTQELRAELIKAMYETYVNMGTDETDLVKEAEGAIIDPLRALDPNAMDIGGFYESHLSGYSVAYEEQGFIWGVKCAFALLCGAESKEGEGKMNKKNLDIVNDIMATMLQTDEWFRINKDDPMIETQRMRVDSAIDSLAGLAPDALISELEDATRASESALTDAAFLYGIHVGLALHDVSAKPDEYGKYVFNGREV